MSDIGFIKKGINFSIYKQLTAEMRIEALHNGIVSIPFAKYETTLQRLQEDLQDSGDDDSEMTEKHWLCIIIGIKFFILCYKLLRCSVPDCIF
jgi:hypothetical protein